MNLLYIEDDFEYHNMVDMMLAPMSVKIFHAYSVQEGIDILKVNKISFILTDINMEGMDGLSFLAALKKDKNLSKIPIVVVTGNPSSEKARFANEQGAVGFLSKPFTQNELAYLVKTFGVLSDLYSTVDSSEEILMRKKQKLMMMLAKDALERDFNKAAGSFINGLIDIFDFNAMAFYRITANKDFQIVQESGQYSFPTELKAVTPSTTESLRKTFDSRDEYFSNDSLNNQHPTLKKWCTNYGLNGEIILPFLNLDDRDFLLGAGINRGQLSIEGFFWGFRNGIFSTKEQDIIKRMSAQGNPILSHLLNASNFKRLF